MNSEFYISFIEYHLHYLQRIIITRSTLNILNLHIRSEDFYRELFNMIYGYKLVNANMIEPNASSIDLVDDENKIIFQVTCTSTKEKIEQTLSKEILKEKYSDYSLYFMFIGKNAEHLIGKEYKNPYNISFDSQNHIYDVDILLRKINFLPIDNLKNIYDLVKKYLLPTDIIPQQRVKSLLPMVIKALCTYNDNENFVSFDDTKAFEINQKIQFNHLKESEDLIHEWAPYEGIMMKIYNEFDQSGHLKSKAILMKINRKYRQLRQEIQNEDELFFSIIKSFSDEMIYNQELINDNISEEELEICIQIIVVDAFMRCKIFKNPGGETYDFV